MNIIFKAIKPSNRHLHGEYLCLTSGGDECYGKIIFFEETSLWACEDINYLKEHGNLPFIDFIMVKMELPTDEDVNNFFPTYKEMPDKGLLYNEGKRIGAKFILKLITGQLRDYGN